MEALLVMGALAVLAVFVGVNARAGEGQPAEEGGAVSDWNRYDLLFQKYADQFGVPWEWLKAFAIVESDDGRDPLVVAHKLSRDGKSKGLMQLTLPTAQDYEPGVTLDDLDDPETSVRIAAQYVAYLSRLFSGDTAKIAQAYNEGQGNVLKGVPDEPYLDKWNAALTKVKENP